MLSTMSCAKTCWSSRGATAVDETLAQDVGHPGERGHGPARRVNVLSAYPPNTTVLLIISPFPAPDHRSDRSA